MPISVRYTSFPSLFFYIYIYSWPTAKKKKQKKPAKCRSLYVFSFFLYSLWPTAKNRQSAYLYISIPSFFILNIYSMAHGQKRQSANLYTSFFLSFLLSMAHGQKPAKCLSLYSLYFFSLFFYTLLPTAKNGKCRSL